MPFSKAEQTEHLEVIENVFWSKRRPPPAILDQVREGQRLEGQSIELFLVRPHFADPKQTIEEPIAKITYLRSKALWQIYWKRASGKWATYSESPTTKTLTQALQTIDQDKHCCFFG